MRFHFKGGNMKLKAKKSFERVMDATIGRFRKEGEEFFADEKRASVLLERGLVEIVPEEEIKEEPKPKKKKSKKDDI